MLFDELGLPKTKKIKTGYTTDADAIQWLAQQSDHPLLGHLLRHRDVSRLLTTVEKQLLPMVDDHGRIHTTYEQMVAATGRLSSTDPNLQNIPIRTAEGREIRQAFVVGVADDGVSYESLMTADYSQIEMRILAHLSEDVGLLDAFASGEDLHTTTASRVFDVPPDRVDPELRRRIKAMSYGLAYGLSAFGLAQQLQITPDEAKEQMSAYFERFGGVRDYLHDVVEKARGDGYTETILGRRRYLPDLVSDNSQRRQMAERMALNAPIQGSAADIIKLAMLGVDRALTAEGMRSRLLLQVHDELVLEVAPGERESLERLVRREMADAYPLSAALEVSAWASAAPGTTPATDPVLRPVAAVERALQVGVDRARRAAVAVEVADGHGDDRVVVRRRSGTGGEPDSDEDSGENSGRAAHVHSHLWWRFAAVCRSRPDLRQGGASCVAFSWSA